ncbi:HNH endonuclease [Microbacterium aurantiacum]|uniref:HNH endonuclease n=1 Tax=Microbacterium aurantiacum TaxID=162393 RepID=UPI00342C07B7
MATGIPGRTTAAHRRNRANLRKAVAEHNLPCAECGEPFDLTLRKGHPDSFEYGHIKSIKTHPELADDPTNGQPEHSRCNRARGTKAARPGLGDASEVW